MNTLKKILMVTCLFALLAFPAQQPVFAHEEHEHLHVVIDIKPGSYPNAINLKSKGLVPVALMGGYTVDLSEVVPSSVRFGPMHLHENLGATPVKVKSDDVNGDGIVDLIFYFKVAETQLKPSDTQACLNGYLSVGTHFCGHDEIKVIG